MTNETMTENGALDYLENDWDFCPVCGAPERECTCPAAEDAPAPAAPVQDSAKAGLDRIAEIKAEYADAPAARMNAIRNYLREQREAKRAAKVNDGPMATYMVDDKNGRRLIKARSYAAACAIARGGAR